MPTLSAADRERLKNLLRQELNRQRARQTGMTVTDVEAEEPGRGFRATLREGLAPQRARATGMSEEDARVTAWEEEEERARLGTRATLREGLVQQRAQATGMSESDVRYGEARMPGKVKGQEAPQAESLEHRLLVQRCKATGASEAEVLYGTRNDRTTPEAVAAAPVRLNAGWYDLSRDGTDGISLADGVTYLWLIREDDHLILGVENPEESAEAFGSDPSGLRTLARNAIENLGHPTLGAEFGADGTLQVGEGRIGGELRMIDGFWMINDSSGRYSAGREETEKLLLQAAELFQHCGVDVRGIKTKAMKAWKLLGLD